MVKDESEKEGQEDDKTEMLTKIKGGRFQQKRR